MKPKELDSVPPRAVMGLVHLPVTSSRAGGAFKFSSVSIQDLNRRFHVGATGSDRAAVTGLRTEFCDLNDALDGEADAKLE